MNAKEEIEKYKMFFINDNLNMGNNYYLVHPIVSACCFNFLIKELIGSGYMYVFNAATS